MLDLDAYLERIGLSGRPSVEQVHRAHLTSIPFENLDPHQGLPVSLELEDIERKLVTERRGGYCFEQNLLLKAALEALGAEVDVFLARTRLGGQPGVVRPRTHLLLRASEDGASWHADVGFGARGIFEPIPFGSGLTQEQFDWSFRVVEDGSELVLQKLTGDEWEDLYSFLPEPVPLVDVETANWWTSTHPDSLFVTGLIVGIRGDDGTGTLLCDWSELAVTELTPAGTSVTPLEREAIPELLATRFSLPGFALGAGERLVRARETREAHGRGGICELIDAVENRRSRAIPERLGFAEEGRRRQAERVGDRYLDSVAYSMLAADWPVSAVGVPAGAPILILTGPPGAGKTTTAGILAERGARAVHLESDLFFRFIRSGYVEPWKPESHDQNQIVMRIVAQAAAAYAAAGYFTIVDGIVIPGWFFEPLRDALHEAGHQVAYAVLRAPLSVCSERAQDREHEPLSDPKVIERLWRAFSDLGDLEGNALDVSGLSPEEAADEIAKRMADGLLAA